jgi:hypothetical protein
MKLAKAGRSFDATKTVPQNPSMSFAVAFDMGSSVK